MQQILLKTARDNLRKKGVVEFECSDSETSETEPQGKVDARTKKRKRSSKEEPRPKPTRGGSSRGTNKLSPKPVRGQNNSSAVYRLLLSKLVYLLKSLNFEVYNLYNLLEDMKVL